MKRSLILILVVFYIFNSSSVLAGTDQDNHNTLVNTKFLVSIKEIIAQFSLVEKNPNSFSIGLDLNRKVVSEIKRNYFKPAVEMSGVNFIVWAFGKYALKGSWTNISLQSIYNNFKQGFAWDYDSFGTNHMGHAYHGAMFHSIARLNGMDFYESSLYTILGGLTWELLWETESPSKNDVITTAIGGITLGEILYRTANLIDTDGSKGLGTTLLKTLKFFINPISTVIKRKDSASRSGSDSRNHNYSLNIPFGAYSTSNKKITLQFSTNLEYNDALQGNITEINPFDWFSFTARFGLNERGFRDAEILTTGILFGGKIRNGLAGLFGTFDYIDTQTAKKYSAAGVGPGLVIRAYSDSDLFFKSSGLLSFIFGGSSPTIHFEHPRYEEEQFRPHHYGPGIMGKIKLELGKKGLGSIHTAFSQYCLRSVYAEANEALGIWSLNLNYDVSGGSQISIGYNYYLRNATLGEQRYRGAKNTVRAMYVLNF